MASSGLLSRLYKVQDSSVPWTAKPSYAEPAEKRYFRIRSNPVPGGSIPNYLKLFDALEIQTDYDDERARSALGFSRSDHRFLVTKRYLHNRLADTLRAYHAEAFPEELVLRELSLARIMLRKSQWELARKSLKRTDDLIARYDMLGLAYQRAEVSRTLAIAAKTPGDDKDLRAICTKLDRALRDQQEENKQRLLTESLIREHYRLMLAQESDTHKRITQQWDALTVRQVKSIPSWRARLARAAAAWHHMEGRPDEAAHENAAMLEALDAHPAIRDRYADLYLSHLSNLLIDLFGQGLYKEMIQGVDRLRDALLVNTRRRLQAQAGMIEPERTLFLQLGRWLRAGLGDRRAVLIA